MRSPTTLSGAGTRYAAGSRAATCRPIASSGAQNGKGYEEVVHALTGLKSSMVRINDRAEVIVSVAVPVQRFRAVRGALMLSTQGADIDDMVTAERVAIFRVFLIAAGVMIVLSFLLAGTIAGPVRRLADSADVVRRRIRSRVEIPDFTKRRDEIGHLSGSLREMTNALYSRIEAIERFAADVAHELKNPLTSLRSAVETLPLAKTDESRARLLAVIQHDVKRLDRLISDIADASRLDAELQRHEAGAVDLVRLLTTLVAVANEVPHENGVRVTLNFEGGIQPMVIPGHDFRLGQVIDNLIDNARSFSPPNGRVRVFCRKLKNEVEIIVDDDGPGIRPDAMEKIFERFYTDRPHQSFGQNSGLGLSICQADRRGARRPAVGGEPRWARSRTKTASRWFWARASSCACPRPNDRSDGACLGGAGRQPRSADPRCSRQRQVAARAGAHRCRAGRHDSDSHGLSLTTARSCRPVTADSWCGRRRRSKA